MSRRRGGGRPPVPPAPASGRRHTPRRSARDNVRVAAAWILERTLASSAPVDSFLDGALPRFDARDQALLRELVLGSLRWLRRLDHVITVASHRGFEEIEEPLRAPLRIAVYQLLFLRKIPPHAAVHEAVEQARYLTHRGGASFVNAVLRRIARSPELDAWPVEAGGLAARWGIELSHPEWLVRRWLDRFGEATCRQLLLNNNRSRPLQLLAFRDRGGRELLAEQLIEEGLEVEPSALSPLGLTMRRGNPLESRAFDRGDFYVQDEVSQVAALLPLPEPGERTLDLAAAPGGKSFAALGWDPELPLLMADASLPRLRKVVENFRRLGRCRPLLVADAGAAPLKAGSFDRVIADLPCSGTGTFRKHPELKWRLSLGELERLARQAERLLAGAAELVAPGGKLVAITCSLEEEENERVVANLRERRADLEPCELEPRLVPPLDRWVEGPGLWRILPADDHDGFTVQVLERREKASGGGSP